ncbi:MAG: glutamate formimidoyltransferase, partial [Anaerolineales bacterium]
MPNPLIECIPNFSEARRPEVIDQIAAAISSVEDVRLLNRSSDLDHNRTVLTFAGPPFAVEEAAFRTIQTAAELINMDNHTGEHPRLGATDVMPFVPLSEVTMDDCVAMAKRLGERVGNELSIPVYLYEAAATRAERVNLENIRKGQYEGLKSEIESDPDRTPDYGPSKLGAAGATVIGARNPLIAFNVYLTTADVDIAKKIAKAIRQSSGGLRYVKALGLLVEGRAQVSLNLTNYRETPVARVVEMIRREAARYGVGIHHSELVGLIPQDALTDAAVWHMQLDQFDKAQILESRLYEAHASAPADNGPSFIEELAAPTPTPGGGSAAAYSGAMGAALVAMVAGLTIGKKKYANVE